MPANASPRKPSGREGCSLLEARDERSDDIERYLNASELKGVAETVHEDVHVRSG
jgi:hypothetical protein